MTPLYDHICISCAPPHCKLATYFGKHVDVSAVVIPPTAVTILYCNIVTRTALNERGAFAEMKEVRGEEAHKIYLD